METSKAKNHRWVSLLLMLHLGLCLLALAANLAPSSLQQSALMAASPYLKTLNLELGLVPIELTHNFQQVEGPYWFEVQTEGDAEGRWRDIVKYFPSPIDRLRLQRLGKEIAALQLEEREDDVATILSQLVAFVRKASPAKEVERIRLQREIIFNRADFTSPEYSALSEQDKRVSLFQAKVVVLDGEVSLVRELEERRASKSLMPNEDSPSDK
jgi:hypothetical protein